MSRPVLIIAALLCLSGCGSAPAPTLAASPPAEPIPVPAPSSPMWVLKPGSWQEYQISRGAGTFDETTGYITIDPTKFISGEVNRNTNLAYQSTHGPAIARVYSPAGVSVTSVPAQLAGCLLERMNSTGYYIGEAGRDRKSTRLNSSH